MAGVESLAVLHWDVCPSAKSCHRGHQRRKTSATFGVERDGTVYQWLDPGTTYGWHSGFARGPKRDAAKRDGRGDANRQAFVSFDLSSMVLVGKETGRPIITASPHGRPRRLMGMTRAQIVSTLRVCAALAKAYPPLALRFPLDAGRPIERIIVSAPRQGGVCSHLHISPDKWDVAGFEAQIAVLLAHEPALRKEFAGLASAFDLDIGYISGLSSEWTWPEVLGGT